MANVPAAISRRLATRHGGCVLGVGLACLLLAPASLPANPRGNALEFDGVDDIVVIPHDSRLAFAALEQATFELWLRPTAAPAVWHAFGKRTDCNSNAGIHYQLARDSLSLVAFGTSGCGVSLGQDLPLDRWSHLAITVDGNEFRMYLDGEFKSSRTCQLGSSNAANLLIGNSDNCADRFPGQIDDFRIWSRIRSPEEIADTYACETTDDVSELIAYWSFDESLDSQEVLDTSGSGLNGTLGMTSAPGADDPGRIATTLPLPCGLLADGFEPR